MTLDRSWDVLAASAVSVLMAMCQACLLVYSLHSFHLLWLFFRKGRPRLAGSPPRSVPEADLPRVTVQLPVFNERFTVKHLLRCVAALDYPVDKLTVQVLDDSTDDTVDIVREELKLLAATSPLRFQHLHREHRKDFKAGALAEGTKVAEGEFLAIFDADFAPTPDFLRQVIPRFLDDARIGCVQCRWGHANRGYSMFTHLQVRVRARVAALCGAC